MNFVSEMIASFVNLKYFKMEQWKDIKDYYDEKSKKVNRKRRRIR